MERKLLNMHRLALRAKLDYMEGLLLPCLADRIFQERPAVADMIHAHSLRAVQMPQRHIIKIFHC